MQLITTIHRNEKRGINFMSTKEEEERKEDKIKDKLVSATSTMYATIPNTSTRLVDANTTFQHSNETS